MKRVVILTGHFPHQKRRGSILWISQHLQAMGWHVTHVTVGYSWLSKIKKDRRLAALETPAIPQTKVISETLTHIFRLPPVHPMKTGVPTLDHNLGPVFNLFPMFWARHLKRPLAQADLVICESGPPVMLAPLLSRFAPQADRIYRVNDNIRLLNAPDRLIEREETGLRHFTRISTASPHLAALFEHANVTLDPMGVPYAAVNSPLPTPFKTSRKIAVCAGTTQLDMDAVIAVALAKPEWDIHVLGRTRGALPALNNITWHAEQPFENMLPYVAHADIGLAPYLDAPGIEYQTSNSNRILLYRHFGLPILGPDRLCDPKIPSIIGYSAPNGLARCEVFVKQPEQIPDWSVLAQRLIQNVVITPPTEVVSEPEIAV